MSNKLTESQVLKVLDIPDFRHLTKDKVMSFASMLSEMQPEVAIKALEQFPNFSSTVMQIATELKETMGKGMENNSESMKRCSDILQTIIDSLQEQVNRNDISFEERRYYIDKMLEVAEMQNSKDTENKEFIHKVFTIAAGAALFLGSTMLVVLGAKADFKLPIKNK